MDHLTSLLGLASTLAVTTKKSEFSGEVLCIQPRIRLLRSFDERAHSYLGYVLAIRGRIDTEREEFSVAIGKAAHQKHQFRAGDIVSGKALPITDPKMETAHYYRVSGLKRLSRSIEPESSPPRPSEAGGLHLRAENGENSVIGPVVVHEP